MSGREKRQRKAMRRRYLGLGAASVVVGGFFLTLTALTTVTLFRVAMFSFFLVLGVIDLALYSAFRKR